MDTVIGLQEDCDLFMNNINSLCRDSLNGKSPYEVMLFLCDEYILKKLNVFLLIFNFLFLNCLSNAKHSF